MNKVYLFLLPLLLIAPLSAAAQSLPIGDPFETYQRIISPVDSTETQSSYTLRPIPYQSTKVNTPHPWQNHPFFLEKDDRESPTFTLLNPVFFTSFNSRYPVGQNDGALWQGRGFNSTLSFGANLNYGPLQITFRPEIGYSQNRDFNRSPIESRRNEYGFPFRGGVPDVPERFGDESLTWFHPGQSSIQLQHSGFAVGFSSANVWMGPAMHNPLILSNNAPGFNHAFIGTTQPFTTPIGSFETKVYWGGLRESEWFDNNPHNNLRFATGILFAYSPSFIPGLTVGGTRTKYEPFSEDGITLDQMRIIFSMGGTGDTNIGDSSQYMSVFGRWSFPQYGLEIWGDWGLNDGRQSIRSLLLIPEHSRAYNLGLLKRFEIPDNRRLLFEFEMTQIEHDRTLHSSSAAAGIWYSHHRSIQGWTHEGQILGSGIGVGSNNQRLQTTLYDGWGSAGVSVNRIELHNDKLRRNLSTIRNIQTEEGRFSMHELQSTEFRFGIHAVTFLPHNIELQADMYQSRFINRHNISGNHDWNTHLSVTLRYLLNGGMR